MTWARWLRHLTLYPPLDNNRLPSIHEQKSSVAAVGSHYVNGAGRGITYPRVQTIGIQTSAPAVDLAWPMNHLQPLSATVPSWLENRVLENHPRMKDTFPPIIFLYKHPSNLISPYKSQCMYPHWKKKVWAKVVILIKYDNIMRTIIDATRLWWPLSF